MKTRLSSNKNALDLSRSTYVKPKSCHQSILYSHDALYTLCDASVCIQHGYVKKGNRWKPQLKCKDLSIVPYQRLWLELH